MTSEHLIPGALLAAVLLLCASTVVSGCDGSQTRSAPGSCLPGTQGCRCYSNASCDPVNGVPMACVSGMCVTTVLPSPGDLNGPCLDAGTACNSFDGGPLECNSSRCELAGCPSGTYGCPCGPLGACNSVNGDPVACVDDRCVAQGCAPGAKGCVCLPGGSCSAKGGCVNGVCRFPSPTIGIVGIGVRACDIVLVLAPDVAAQAVRFETAIKGAYLQRGPRLALSFVKRIDA
ncbi:MAG TPA: hypothetical protein VGY54_06895, partial [Polyangiaceae bacterium]|nr:hypothetical protein [Polyangiaceae bacterium]